MNVEVNRMDHQGRGIASTTKPIFIPNTLPGEIVDIKLTKDKSKYAEGIVQKYIKKSESRVEPICQYFNDCGGCDLMHMKYEDTLKYKQDKIQDIVKKFLKEDIKINEIISVNSLNYRNKATFQVKEKVGFYKNKSYEIIDIDKCMIVEERINSILNIIKNNMNLKDIYQIVIRVSKLETMVIFKTNNYFDQKILNYLNDITSIILYKNNKYETVYGKDFIIEELGDYKFIISPGSFFQVNTDGALNLYNKVLEYSNQNIDTLLDLYCGTGTIGIFLSKYAKKVIGVELNKYAVEDANKNRDLNNIDNIEFICSDVKYLKEKYSNIDLVVVDPPRSGIDIDTVNYLKEINSKSIIYVSCDPITLMRDLYLLKDKYKIVELTPVDMFPYTCHVECVCVLKLR